MHISCNVSSPILDGFHDGELIFEHPAPRCGEVHKNENMKCQGQPYQQAIPEIAKLEYSAYKMEQRTISSILMFNHCRNSNGLNIIYFNINTISIPISSLHLLSPHLDGKGWLCHYVLCMIHSLKKNIVVTPKLKHILFSIL